ncbi:MAG: pullulanase-type alpha-1,6-glucosidase [Burkholderiaceae bacterium]
MRSLLLGLAQRTCAATLVALAAMPALAAGEDRGALLAACDAPAVSTTLLPHTEAAAPARAVWLDRATLLWPGRAADGRYRLAYAVDGGIGAAAGAPLRGAQASLVLAPVDGPLDPAIAARVAYLGDGARLRLGESDAQALPAMLRGELLVVHEAADGRIDAAARVQSAWALDDAYAAAASRVALGAEPGDGDVRLALWAPTARAVHACRYPGPEAPASGVVALARDEASGVWQGRLGAPAGAYYTYLVDVFIPGTGVVRNRVTDPYAVTLNADLRRVQAVSLDDPALAPAGWGAHPSPATVARPTDMSIYELHVRDFSANDASVPAAHRGRYLAFTDAGSAGMRHLRALAAAGLTDVHLLPVFDFSSVPERRCASVEPMTAADRALTEIPGRPGPHGALPVPPGGPAGESQQAAAARIAATDCFNWGYDPLHYGAPEGGYATDADDGAVRVREFRAMVEALHAAGLRVGMDVVYNHTPASGQAELSELDRTVPGYYQRLDKDGAVERSTCCDDTAPEHAMMGRLVVDTALRFATQYRIDSFRFDLMGHLPRALLETLQHRLREATGHEVPLIGEGWNFGEVADGARFVQASQLSLAGSGIGTFNDRLRDALRGGSATDGAHVLADQGWLNGESFDPNGHGHATRDDLAAAADLVRAGLAGSLRDFAFTTRDGTRRTLRELPYGGQPAGYASAPAEAVNYVENHDNLTLWDNDTLKLPRSTSREDRARVQVLGAAVVAFSQGVAYFHAGVDTLRSKSFDGNSFDSGDWFNRLDWTGADNGFGSGLPAGSENGARWPVLAPFLADASLKPTPADIAWTRDAFRDLLRIRASSALFHLASADDVRARLSFPAASTGPQADPAMVVERLDGRGLPDARFGAVLLFLNADRRAHAIRLPEEAGRAWTLHPVQRSPRAADRRVARAARVDTATATFTIPARSAAVFVSP